MLDNVAAFEGDSTTIKIFPLPLLVLTALTFVFVLAAVDFFAAVFLVFVVLAAVVFLVFLVFTSVSADDFLDAGIVITPV